MTPNAAPRAAIILAAGQGTRMKSSLPKVLHPLGGAPLVIHALKAAAALDPAQVVVVTGSGAPEVEAAVLDWNPEAVCVRQDQQLGTGHAVQQAQGALAGATGPAIVLYGDTPFVRPETLEAARQIYLEAGIDAEVAPFFHDMAQRLSAAHLVIGRAGASTCSELAVRTARLFS